MSIKKTLTGAGMERLPDVGFCIMLLMFAIYDLFPGSRKRFNAHVKSIGIKEGDTVVDYGCGPGRYITEFSKQAGENGRVYACDIHEMAIRIVEKKIKKMNIKNVVPILVKRYSSGVPDDSADIICALDMFHFIKEPTPFLAELRRIIKKDGVLIIDDGHQPRELTKRKIDSSKLWTIVAEEEDLLKCHPLPS